MSEVRIRIPWKVIFHLGPHILKREPTDVDGFTRELCAGISPTPTIEGREHLPTNPTFVLAANHYQRKGLWILFPAAVLTQLVRRHYGEGNPPIRWMVTANWPRMHLGPFSFPSPGDILLPRVADALACYPVSFAGTNQRFTARSLRRILREAPQAGRPLGVFPEGVGGSAGVFSEPIAGVDRLFVHLARAGMPVVPVHITEADGRLVFQVRPILTSAEILSADNAARRVMQSIRFNC